MTKTFCDYVDKAKQLETEGPISRSYIQRKLKLNPYVAALVETELKASKKREGDKCTTGK